MNSIVNTITKNLPDYWDKNISYQNPYRRINVSIYRAEYDKISDILSKAANDYHHQLRRLERVQNVYAYGQFIVREQFFINNAPLSTCYRVQRFYVLRKIYLEDAIEYNLDPRRIGVGTTTITFLSKINFVPDDHVVLVLKVLTYNPNQDSITPERSSDYFIEYVAYLD
ncbi:uncharacterized protein LOC108742571 [Agrilus planipennis]|uniref:Uncharacterized protein LOC108742571 n=1 Tax=Agrilus planipennis TaxID=224129 RepID=A0A1W4XBE4_AGRPL|nr:uncharacterized protein LOC108742571 [Agrilus planipennis]